MKEHELKQIGNLRIDLFVAVMVDKCVLEKPVNPKCGLRVEWCGGWVARVSCATTVNRHEDNTTSRSSACCGGVLVVAS